MENIELKEVLQKYLNIGILWGYELLLTPDFAIHFIDDLDICGVIVTGCDLWRFVKPDKDPKWIVDLTGAGILVDYSETDQENSPKKNAEIVKSYISHDLPVEADLISLLYDDNHVDFIYDFFQAASHSA